MMLQKHKETRVKKVFMIGLYDMKPEKQLIRAQHKDYVYMPQLQGTATVQLFSLAKQCSFIFITLLPNSGLEPMSQSLEKGFGKQWM